MIISKFYARVNNKLRIIAQNITKNNSMLRGSYGKMPYRYQFQCRFEQKNLF